MHLPTTSATLLLFASLLVLTSATASTADALPRQVAFALSADELGLTLRFPPLLVPSSSSSGAGANTNHSLFCDLCTGVTDHIRPLILDQRALPYIEDVAFAYCLYTELESKEYCQGYDACHTLCEGVIGDWGAIVVGIAANTSLSSQAICHRVGLCPAPPPAGPPIAGVPVPSNVTDLRGQRKWPMWSTSGSGTFLHLTDMHWDPQYREGLTTLCPLPLCCRDSAGNGSAGPFGDYNCDSPQRLLTAMFDFLNATLSPRPDFIFYTGDDPAHNDWEQTFDGNLGAIAHVSAELLRYFPDVPVFSAIGNHENCPVNLFAGPGKDSSLYTALAADWGYYLTDQAERTLSYGGYFATLIRPGLYAVSINSGIYDRSDFFVSSDDPQDVSAQLPWLNDTLYQIAQLRAQAVILGHASPWSWYPVFAQRFNALLDVYHATVVNVFWGHTHNNEVQLYHPAASPVPHTVGYIGGSITPYQNVNPGLTVLTYNRSLSSPFLVQDIAYHWVDLTAANAQGTADWSTVQMSAIANFSLSSLSPQSWYELAESMRMNQSAAVYERMLQVYTKGLWTGGQSSAEERQRFGCKLENDNALDAGACQQELGLEVVAAGDSHRRYGGQLRDCSGKIDPNTAAVRREAQHERKTESVSKRQAMSE